MLMTSSYFSNTVVWLGSVLLTNSSLSIVGINVEGKASLLPEDLPKLMKALWLSGKSDWVMVQEVAKRLHI